MKKNRAGAGASALVVFLVAGICLVAVPAVAPVPAHAAVVYNPDVATMIDNVTRRQLEPVVDELSGEAPATIGGSSYTFTTRASSSGTPIDRAEQYVYEHLRTYGLDSVVYQDFPGGGGAPPGRNIIGQVNGTTRAGEIIIVGAHIDNRPWSGRAPGADDDASGVSALLHLARSFADKTFERTIRFAFFGDEENAPWNRTWGSLYGSGYYAARCRAAGENIVAMIEADMLAYDPPGSSSHIVEMNTRRPANDRGGGDLAIFTMWRDAITIYSITGITPKLVAIGDNWSDHGSFWRNGYTAGMLIEEELVNWNRNWHTKTDKVSTFSWPFYAAVTKSLVAVAAHEAGILN